MAFSRSRKAKRCAEKTWAAALRRAKDQPRAGSSPFRPNASGDLSQVVMDEVADPMVRDVAQAGPSTEHATRGFVAGGEEAADAEADDIRGPFREAGAVGGASMLRALSQPIHPPRPEPSSRHVQRENLSSKPVITAEILHIRGHNHPLAVQLRESNQTGVGVVHALAVTRAPRATRPAGPAPRKRLGRGSREEGFKRVRGPRRRKSPAHRPARP